MAGDPGVPNTRRQMQDAVADVVQKVASDKAEAAAAAVAEREKARRRRRRALDLIVFGIVAFLAALTISLPRLSQPIRAPSGPAADAHARAALVFAARIVDSYQAAHGRLPASLAAAGIALPGITYEVVSGGYQLTAQVDGEPLTLAGGDDREAFSRGGRGGP